MKLDNVFVAFLKIDGDEHLLYKKSDNLYIDLNTKEKYTNDDIDLNTIIYFKDTIIDVGYCNSMLKHCIKKIYNKDRDELLDISSLCIGDVKVIKNLEKTSKPYGIMDYKWTAVFLYRNILKRCSTNSYTDIRTGENYLGEDLYYLKNGDLYIDDGNEGNIIQLKGMFPHLKRIEKKRVLKLAYNINNDKKI